MTYEDVVATLPPDIVEAIEVSRPCAGGFDHLWNEERFVDTPSGPVRSDLWWWCVHCRVTTWTRPIPPVNRPWAIITADEILRELR